jgi:hypothetical protein
MRLRRLDAVSFGAGGFTGWMLGDNHGLGLWQEVVVGVCAAIAMGALWCFAAYAVKKWARGASR